MTNTHGEISARLRTVTDQLRDLERDLKSEQQPDAQLVQNFRDALDSSRMTAWTVTELLNARERTLNPHVVASFLTAERIRRFAQMTRDLCADIDNRNINLQHDGIGMLSEALDLLRSQLDRLAKKR